jgi:hypothetical protein
MKKNSRLRLRLGFRAWFVYSFSPGSIVGYLVLSYS